MLIKNFYSLNNFEYFAEPDPHINSTKMPQIANFLTKFTLKKINSKF